MHKGQLIFYESMGSLKQKYKVIECSQDDYSRIEKGVIVGEYTRNGYHYALVNINDITSEINLPMKTPTLDDIMLAYIKGGSRYAGID